MIKRPISHKLIYLFLPLFFSLVLLQTMHTQIIRAVPNTPGDLDTTFGVNGIAVEDLGANERGRGLALRADNKIWVIADSFNENFSSSQSYLLLYNSDGTLDTSFGTNGVASVAPINPTADDGVSDIALQADGKVVVVGSVNTNGNTDFAVFRFMADGSVDSSFGAGGVVTTTIGLSVDAKANSVAMQADGKIVAAGENGRYGVGDFALVRYLSDGSLDLSFGVGGVVTTNFPARTGYCCVGGAVDWANDVIVQADGKIVAVGFSGGAFGMARYEENGSFGNSGIVTTVVGLEPFSFVYANAVVQQPDGKLLVSGRGYDDVNANHVWALVRYNTDGSLDNTFGMNGIVKTDFGGESYSSDMIIRPNGQIVLVGAGDDSGLYASVVLYNEDGSIDTSFGTGGSVHMSLGSWASGVIAQPDGKLIILGDAGDLSKDIFIARYEGPEVDLGHKLYLPTVQKP